MGQGRRKVETKTQASRKFRKTSGVRGDDRGREASGVAHESPGVRGKEGVREASRGAETPRGSRQGVGGGVELPQGKDTAGVAELPQGGETSRVNIAGASKPRG